MGLENKMAVNIESVSKEFGAKEGLVRALDKVSCQIREAEFLAIAGSSGSGKTTLLNLIGGLDRPSAGKILVYGKNLGQMQDVELSNFRRHQLGFIFQTFNLLPVLSARENIEYPLLQRPEFSDSQRKEMALEALAQVNLVGLSDRRPNELSGGQRQRVAIARALVHKPKLIIADEPTANLDKKNAKEIIDLLKKMNLEKQVTVIFATHDPMIMEAATRILKVSDGKIDNQEQVSEVTP